MYGHICAYLHESSSRILRYSYQSDVTSPRWKKRSRHYASTYSKGKLILNSLSWTTAVLPGEATPQERAEEFHQPPTSAVPIMREIKQTYLLLGLAKANYKKGYGKLF